MIQIIEKLRNELLLICDEKVKLSSQRYFKEKVQFHGVNNPNTTKIANKLFSEIKDKSKPEIFEFCETLWSSGYMEEAIAACNWSYRMKRKYEPTDFKIFYHWIDKYVTNWAKCDTFCNHNVGYFVEQYPDYLNKLKEMATSSNRWMRRASAVSLIVPARKGKFLNTIFEIANILLLDKDDLVQKGYGWMLKAASETHQNEVFEYVLKNKNVMPRTALRYAIEKMPQELKNIAMSK